MCCKLFKRYSKGETSHRWKYNTAHALCMQHNQVYKHTIRILNTNCFLAATTTTGRRTNFNVTSIKTVSILFIALIAIWNETPYQLLTLTADPIPSHNYMFMRSGFKTRNVFNVIKYNFFKLQAVTIKIFNSSEACHTLLVLTVLRSSTLVRALAFHQWCWERPSLCCYQIWTSWGKHELDHHKSL